MKLHYQFFQHKRTSISPERRGDNASLNSVTANANVKVDQVTEEEITIITLDDWWEGHQTKFSIDDIRFIKLDVQGFEVEVLEGGRKLLSQLAENENCLIECEWDKNLLANKGESDYGKIFKLLRDIGFTSNHFELNSDADIDEFVTKHNKEDLIFKGTKPICETTVSEAPPPVVNQKSTIDTDQIIRALKSRLFTDSPPTSREATRAAQFNQRDRNAWIRQQSKCVPPGSRVLDVGAGTAPYAYLFDQCEYVTHDFGEYEGVKLGGGNEYGNINIQSDINSIPLNSMEFDYILCTEVLEHVPHPDKALQEMARLLKPGGIMWLTAPLGSGLHQEPYHFYGGFTPHWYHHFSKQVGLEVEELEPNGRFFKMLAQETNRAARLLDSNLDEFDIDRKNLYKALLNDILPPLFCGLDDQIKVRQFTIGYHVRLRKNSYR